MLTLHDFPFSGNSYKVRLVLHELGLPYRRVVVDLLRGETRTAAFLALNPAGQVPVLVLDDGTALRESTAILLHLAEGTALLPAPGLARTRVVEWMCFEQTQVDGVISRARFRRAFPALIPTRPEEFEAWEREGCRALAVLDARLAAAPHLTDDGFTVADLCLYAYVHVAEEGGFPLGAYPHVGAWLARVRGRPRHVALGA